MAVMAGDSVGFATGVERASTFATLTGVGVASLATAAGVALGGGVVLARRLSADLVFEGDGPMATGGGVGFATGAGVVLATRLSAVRVLEEDGSADFAGSD